ncbi:arabinofuranan 3-O-arabinosyltransferase [Kibdelosporangium banguiense]|uniref:Arabinofuranan 3-O-arabinosyltransferase n=1 Tax=Kibdelosporangium banguiense TaxID=1365924 RepID=A0ABS4U021_9PSEU|nr:arabinofuranan 3-O-arabinosyltransferase [Kibdelosporangium banguiense]
MLTRLRNPTVLVMLGLTVLSFLQRPGTTTFDTKLDLAVDPVAFLGRALHLWNPAATGGELQNQAYGYLFPMGPFFAGFQLIGVPPWIAQRLWCALLLCLAFAGVLAVARALKIGTPAAQYTGAVAYALAPRMLTEIGPLSAEMLAAVMLPWVLLPLIKADRIGSPRRAAGLSGLAILCIGGINGAVVMMVLLLPGLWLLTRQWTKQHVKLVLWWCAAVVAAVVWWFLPLMLLGEYSLPFVDYVESATNTTAPMSLFQALRGTNQWVAYVFEGSPWWPSGFMLIDNPVLMFATGLVAAVGLVGIVRRGLPERMFITIGVITAVTFLTIGYVGELDSPLSTTVRALLDGPLAPLRNVHKFEPGLRLPLMLGFMHAVSRLGVPARARLSIGVALVLVMAAPAWLFTLRPGPGWQSVPDYWRTAMTWLGDNDPDARTLLVPGTGFGEYTWGKTVDEPAQALARSPWALRSQIPLGSEGNTRLMDAVEDALADGRGSPGLADFLARSGHRFLLLRNDIDRAATNAPPVTMMRDALARSPGIELIKTFGPDAKPSDQPAVSSVDLDAPASPTLEIYEVKRPVARAMAVNATDIATVSGGPESLLPLLDAGVLQRDRPAVLAGDSNQAPGQDWLVTDGLRHRERNVGRVRDNLSQTLAADEQPRQDRPATDILPFQGLQHQTVAAYRGIRGVTASSSTAFADSVKRSDPSSMPFAAIDGDPFSAWQSSTVGGPAGQWLEVELDTPRVVDEVDLRIVDDSRVGWPVTRIRITTDSGSRDHDVGRGGTPQKFPVSPGLTSKIRVTVLSVAANRDTGAVGIAELAVPGVTAQRALQAPSDVTPSASQRTSFVFSRGAQPRYACAAIDREQRCDSGLTRLGEEPDGVHRLFRTSQPGNYRLEGTVLPSIGGKVPVPAQISASTQLAGDQAAGAWAAIDGDAATTWISDYTDQDPTIVMEWPQVRNVNGLKLTTSATSGASRPTEVEIRTPILSRTVPVFSDGSVDFVASTNRLDITITKTEGQPGRPAGPAGISEVKINGAEDLFKPIPQTTPFTVPCGSGPAVTVDGVAYQTTVSGTLADIVNHRPLALGTCRDLVEGIDLQAREHELLTAKSEAFVVQDIRVLPNTPPAAAPRQRAIDVREWGVAQRELRVAPGEAAILSIPENANEGWVAKVDGTPLARTRVDGWQQAWVLPGGGEVTVSLQFEPDIPYRQRLLIGAIAAGLLLIVTLLPVRRRVPVSTSPGGRRWVPVALVILLAALGGVLAIVLLIASLLVAYVFRRRRAVSGLLAGGGMAIATVVAVIGRVQGHGQDWAYGTVAQAAILLSLAAAASASIDWFDPRPGVGAAELDDGSEAGQRGGRDDGPGDDLRQRPVPPAQHQSDLHAHGQPRQQGRPPVGTRDPGVQQDLHQRQQRPDQRERPDGNAARRVRRSPDQ